MNAICSACIDLHTIFFELDIVWIQFKLASNPNVMEMYCVFATLKNLEVFIKCQEYGHC
jgi:hypothetical protein